MRTILSTLLLILTAACSNKLQDTWFVISDDKFSNERYYRSIFSFTKDSLLIDYLAANGEHLKIVKSRKSYIECDSFPLINYKLNQDTLSLRFARSKFDTVALRLMPFKPIDSEISVESFEKLLIENNWQYEYRDIKFTTTFLDSLYNYDVRHAEVQVSYNNKLNRTLELPLCKAEEYDSQLILIIESAFDHYYANVFYVVGLNSNDDIITRAWQYGDKYDIIFNKQKLIDKLDLHKTNEKLIGTWTVQNNIEIPEPQIDPNDTTYFDLGYIPIWGKTNKNRIIETSDLSEGIISYNFNPDDSYQIKKKDSIVCSGNWKLQRNGRTVSITNESEFDEEYHCNCNDFQLNSISDQLLEIEHYIPIFENDTIVTDKYYKLTLSRAINNN